MRLLDLYSPDSSLAGSLFANKTYMILSEGKSVGFANTDGRSIWANLLVGSEEGLKTDLAEESPYLVTSDVRFCLELKFGDSSNEKRSYGKLYRAENEGIS